MPIAYWIGVAVVLAVAWFLFEINAQPDPDRLFAARAVRAWQIPVMLVLVILLGVVVPRLLRGAG